VQVVAQLGPAEPSAHCSQHRVLCIRHRQLVCCHCWVRVGVVDAIRKKYLKKLYFGFSSDPDARQLLEEVRGAHHPCAYCHCTPWWPDHPTSKAFSSTEAPGPGAMLVQYVFSFGYDMHGSVSMALGTRGKANKFAYKHSEPGGEASEAVRAPGGPTCGPAWVSCLLMCSERQQGCGHVI
jgi:hypothetical protein